MLASRAPVSLHRRIVAGGERRRCFIEGKRGSPQRRHFTQALEGLWRHSPRPPPTPAATAPQTEARPKWQPPTLENAAFEEYYKVQILVSVTHGLLFLWL
jgi:multisite-specific tRNA:(cytosine-C5)-methyltransferase